MCKVSIIIPVYNTELYLNDCLESAVNQGCDLEIIAVDDASTDGSYDILENYRKQYPFFFVIRQENKKTGGARNTGLEKARGDYVFFLDSDDWLSPQCIEDLVEKAYKNDLDMLFFNGAVVDEIGDNNFPLNTYDRSRVITNTDKIYTGYELARVTDTLGAGVISACMVLYKRSFLLDNNLTFIENLFFEDNEFSLKTNYLAKRIMYYDKTVYNRRYRKGSIVTTEVSRSHISGMLIIANKIYTWICEQNNQEKNVFWKYAIDFINNPLKMIDDNITQVNEDIKFLFIELIHNILSHKEELVNVWDISDINVGSRLHRLACAFWDDKEGELDSFKNIMINKLIGEANNDKDLIIYGAGKRGENLAHGLQYWGISNRVYFVESEKSKESFCGYPCICVSEIESKNIDRIIISTSKYKEEIIKNLTNIFGNDFIDNVEILFY